MLDMITKPADKEIINIKILSEEDTFDFREFFYAIRDGKFFILGMTVFFVLLSILYVLFSREIWSSHSVVSSPDAGLVAKYSFASNFLDGEKSTRGPVSLYDSFLNELARIDYRSHVAKGARKKLIIKEIKNLKSTSSLAFYDDNAADSQSTLLSLINKANERIITIERERLEAIKRIKIANLEGILKKIEKQESIKHTKQHFVLLKRLFLTESLDLNFEGMKVYDLISPPSMPRAKDSPKTALIFFVAITFSTLAGIVLVVLWSGIKPKRIVT